MGHRPVAVVTGASRGIGRSTALGFARAGYDVVVTARSTTADGAAFAGTTLDDPDAGVTLPGGLPSLVAEITELGVGCVSVAMDLTDRTSVASAAQACLTAFDRVDVLISNAIYQGPGINDPALTVGIEMIDRVVSADAITPLILVQAVLPGMLERGSGVIVHLTSGAATLSPRAPFGKGGWGLAYAIAKGGAHRIVGVLHTEFGPAGVRTYNLNPGHVVTEVGRARSARAGTQATGQSPEVPAAAAVWLAADNDDTRALAGTDLVALDIVKRFGLSTDAA
ncbi:MAG: short-chain dehydrogenase [Acidimicrobiales bacterium]|nr:short-chain dehydrogenase [Acidimicrobiales bacterium]